MCSGSHPTFWVYFRQLQKSETLDRAAIVQAEAGHPPPRQRRRYVDNNRRILNIVDDYPNREQLQYLRSIAHNINF